MLFCTANFTIGVLLIILCVVIFGLIGAAYAVHRRLFRRKQAAATSRRLDSDTSLQSGWFQNTAGWWLGRRTDRDDLETIKSGQTHRIWRPEFQQRHEQPTPRVTFNGHTAHIEKHAEALSGRFDAPPLFDEEYDVPAVVQQQCSCYENELHDIPMTVDETTPGLAIPDIYTFDEPDPEVHGNPCPRDHPENYGIAKLSKVLLSGQAQFDH